METKVCAIQEKNINFANMIELSKHIEVLLLENDCVIVPGLGGFIAHYRSSVYKDDTQEYCPPARTIGFNPQLVMNDGLLVQSYMQAYDTDFPDATRRIEKTVALLKEELYKKGQFALGNVGVLYYNMNGGYGFEPCSEGYFTPSLYGLQRFSLPRLAEEHVLKKVVEFSPSVDEENVTPVSRSVAKPVRQWIRAAVAVAAAILLFFVWSVPVENTYMDDANYASLGSATLFDAIRNQSVNTQVAGSSVRQERPRKTLQKNTLNTLKPVAVKTEKVSRVSTASDKKEEKEKKSSAPAVAPETVVTAKNTKPVVQPIEKAQKTFYIIIASLTTRTDAQREVEKFKAEGCTNVSIIESDGKYRIAYDLYHTQTLAYQKVQELRKQDAFKNAWVFTSNK